MLIKGQVIKLYEDDRVFVVEEENKKETCIHTTIKELRIYKAYLDLMPEVILEAGEEKIYAVNHVDTKTYELSCFKLIKTMDKVFFDQEKIKAQIKSFINSLEYKMFLDLEFSWPVPYTHMPPEIVQFGYVLTDKFDNVIESNSSLVKPIRKSALNKKTLKFLGRTEKDFDDAKSYISFYQLMQTIIKKYNPKIIAWGRNDLIELEQSFRLNHLASLNIKPRFINIMQVMKNYYQLKREIGLFDTYKALAETEYHEQTHDALEDAMLAKEIFMIFKEKIN